MRTTVDLDDDAAKAIEQLRAEQGMGLSDAVNELIRRGLVQRAPARPFRQRTAALGLRIDVSNTADALESLDGPRSR
jgi:hypothetical protein